MPSVHHKFAKTVHLAIIEHIAHAQTRGIQIFWTVCFLAVTTLTIYQCTGLVQQLNAKTVLTSITIKTRPTKPFPAVTICSLNPYKNSALQSLPQFQSLFNAFGSTTSTKERKRRNDIETETSDNESLTVVDRQKRMTIQNNPYLYQCLVNSDCNNSVVRCVIGSNSSYNWCDCYAGGGSCAKNIDCCTNNCNNSVCGTTSTTPGTLCISGIPCASNLVCIPWGSYGYCNGSVISPTELTTKVTTTKTSCPLPQDGSVYYMRNVQFNCAMNALACSTISYAMGAAAYSAANSQETFLFKLMPNSTNIYMIFPTCNAICLDFPSTYLMHGTPTCGPSQQFSLINGPNCYFAIHPTFTAANMVLSIVGQVSSCSPYPQITLGSNVNSSDQLWYFTLTTIMFFLIIFWFLAVSYTLPICLPVITTSTAPKTSTQAPTTTTIITTTSTAPATTSTTTGPDTTSSSTTTTTTSTAPATTLTTTGSDTTSTTTTSLTTSTTTGPGSTSTTTAPATTTISITKSTPVGIRASTMLLNTSTMASNFTTTEILSTDSSTSTDSISPTARKSFTNVTSITKTTTKTTDSVILSVNEILNILNLDNNTDPMSQATTITAALPYIASSLSASLRAELGYNIGNIMLHCTFDEKNCGKDDFVQWNDPTIGNCFTFNHAIGPQHSTEFAGAQHGLSLLFNASQKDYLPTTATGGLLVFITFNNATIFPDLTSFSLPNGYFMDVSIHYQFLKRLQPCITEKTFDNYFYDGEYSDQGCLKTCYQKRVITECGCGDPNYPLPPVLPQIYTTCSLIKKPCVDSIANSNDTVDKNCSCPQQCSEHAFSAIPTVTKARNGYNME